MKYLIITVTLFLLMSATVYADYTIEIKNESNVVIKTYIITTTQVQHMQKLANTEGPSVLKQFETALNNIVTRAIVINKANLRKTQAHQDYEEEQARQ